MTSQVRIASENDWPALKAFFEVAYRPRHPLHRQDFWRWRFGNIDHGLSIVAEVDGVVVGHAGVARQAGYCWMITVWLGEAARGQGFLRRMYDLAREYGPLAAASVNRPGLDMYRNMGWTRYADLQRFVAVNPRLSGAPGDLVSPISLTARWERAYGDHYWDQPGITGYVLPDGSTAVDQSSHGGLRVIDVVDPIAAAESAFAAGVRWLDFVTSWNDPICRTIDQKYWVSEDEIDVPWRLDPVEMGSKAHIAVLSERPLPNSLIVTRRASDHGRIASLDPIP